MIYTYAAKNFSTNLIIVFKILNLDGSLVGNYSTIEISNIGCYYADLPLFPNKDYILIVSENRTPNWKEIKFIGKKYMNTYAASGVESVPGAGKIHYGLFNAAGSNKKIYIDKIVISAVIDAITTGHQISFYMQKSTTVGVGTNDNITKFDSLITSIPLQITIKKNYTTMPSLVIGSILSSGNLDTEESRSGLGVVTMFNRETTLSPIILNEGEGLCLVQDSYASNGKINMIIYFNLGE